MHSALATPEQGAGGLDCELLCVPAQRSRGRDLGKLLSLSLPVLRMAGGMPQGSRSPGGVRELIKSYMRGWRSLSVGLDGSIVSCRVHQQHYEIEV